MFRKVVVVAVCSVNSSICLFYSILFKQTVLSYFPKFKIDYTKSNIATMKTHARCRMQERSSSSKTFTAVLVCMQCN